MRTGGLKVWAAKHGRDGGMRTFARMAGGESGLMYDCIILEKDVGAL